MLCNGSTGPGIRLEPLITIPAFDINPELATLIGLRIGLFTLCDPASAVGAACGRAGKRDGDEKKCLRTRDCKVEGNCLWYLLLTANLAQHLA